MRAVFANRYVAEDMIRENPKPKVREEGGIYLSQPEPHNVISVCGNFGYVCNIYAAWAVVIRVEDGVDSELDIACG